MRDDGQGLEEGIIDKRWHDAHLWLSLGKPLAKQEADVLALRIKHPLVAMMLSESSPETAIPEACLSIGEATSHHHLLSFSALDAARCTNSGLFAYEVDTSATLVAARVENVDRMFLPVVSSLSFLPNFVGCLELLSFTNSLSLDSGGPLHQRQRQGERQRLRLGMEAACGRDRRRKHDCYQRGHRRQVVLGRVLQVGPKQHQDGGAKSVLRLALAICYSGRLSLA